MHNTLAMSKLQSFQNFACVVPNIEFGESGVQGSKVCVVDVFKDYTYVRSLFRYIQFQLNEKYMSKQTCSPCTTSIICIMFGPDLKSCNISISRVILSRLSSLNSFMAYTSPLGLRHSTTIACLPRPVRTFVSYAIVIIGIRLPSLGEDVRS